MNRAKIKIINKKKKGALVTVSYNERFVLKFGSSKKTFFLSKPMNHIGNYGTEFA